MVPILSDKETSTNNLSLSYCYYSDYENETIPSVSMKKKRKVETLSMLFDLDEDNFSRTLVTPKATISYNNFDETEEWSAYPLAPKKSKKQMLYVSDDCIRSAPRFPLLDITYNDDDSIFNLAIAPRFSLFNDNDFNGEAPPPRLPYLDDDWIIGDDIQKENRPPLFMPRITKSSIRSIFM